MERLKNPKLVAALILTALAVVMFWQNSGEIDLHVLFLGSIKTRKATALALAFLAGMVAGALAFSRWKTKREKAKAGTGPA
jgi:hypothetical protein